MNPFAKKQPSPAEVTTLVRAALADNAEAESLVLDGPAPDTREAIESSPDDSLNDNEDRITGFSKLSKLIDDDFPFDESQLDAIHGLAEERYGCLTGAAGTGKTTTTKKLVDTLIQSGDLHEVDMESYWKKGVMPDPDDEQETPEKWVPSVAMCAFTGRATQMVKKNFPRDWHGNIMTIHRMLGFYPEFFEEWSDESGDYKKKMRFVPSYTAEFKLPWDIVIIDEAGMLGVDLWLLLRAALKPGCRVFMIGDINQLPPVHGKSVFGFAMCAWPAWELTHVHRQQGVNNPIVDNAWRILNGRMPETQGRFQMIPLKGDAAFSSRQVRKMLPELQKMGIYDPIRDSVITPINGEDGSRGRELGQIPLNQQLALIFNPQATNTRFIIDGGRERKQFAVGDKVMATKNDWEAGITNGMTGVIISIEANAEYGGNHRLFGPVDDVNAYMAEDDHDSDEVFSLDDLDSTFLAQEKGKEAGKEKRDRGPASHIIVVRFGDAEHGIEVPFASLSEVGTLMTAYAVTCHKMQGGEAPTIVIICHDSHRSMLYREWLYTAVTRASEKCIVLYTEDAMRTALNKQKMKGSTLKQKVMAFNEQQNIAVEGIDDSIVMFSHSTRNRILDRTDVAVVTPAHLMSSKEREGGLMQLLKAKRAAPVIQNSIHAQMKGEQIEREREAARESYQAGQPIHVHLHTHETIVVTPRPTPTFKVKTVDGGDLTPKPPSQMTDDELYRELTTESTPLVALPAPTPVTLVSQVGAAQVACAIDQVKDWSRFLLPAPAPTAPAPKPVFKFGVK